MDLRRCDSESGALLLLPPSKKLHALGRIKGLEGVRGLDGEPSAHCARRELGSIGSESSPLVDSTLIGAGLGSLALRNTKFSSSSDDAIDCSSFLRLSLLSFDVEFD